jgi:cell division septum initiation protein DivIVA
MGSTVERATSIPLSASCMINRAEMLSLVERARAELPVELDEAAALLVAHQDVITRAENDAELLLEQARQQADAMVEDSALVATARGRSEQILDAARAEAARLLRQADEYCDGRLAEFENDLERAMAQVRRGRDRLRERSDLQSVEGPSDTGPGEHQGEVEYVEEEYAQDYAAEVEVEYEVEYEEVAEYEEDVAYDQSRELVHAQVGVQGERRVVDLAGMERGAAERAGLGQRVNLQ